MYKAVGYYSQNEYMVGKTVAEVMRLLQKKYPTPRYGIKSFKSSANNFYAEALKIVDESEMDMQYSK
ncbi:hypothetical protein [Leuconostoc citreum]